MLHCGQSAACPRCDFPIVEPSKEFVIMPGPTTTLRIEFMNAKRMPFSLCSATFTVLMNAFGELVPYSLYTPIARRTQMKMLKPCAAELLAAHIAPR